MIRLHSVVTSVKRPHINPLADLYTYLRPQPAMYWGAQPGHLRPGAIGRSFGFAWWRGVVPKPRWPAARAADRRSRQAPMGAGEVQTAPRGGDAGVAQARSTRGQSGARRTPDAEWTRQSPDTACAGGLRTAALRTYPRAAAVDTPADTRCGCPPAPRGDR